MLAMYVQGCRSMEDKNVLCSNTNKDHEILSCLFFIRGRPQMTSRNFDIPHSGVFYYKGLCTVVAKSVTPSSLRPLPRLWATLRDKFQRCN